jgi:hypothetical protein
MKTLNYLAFQSLDFEHIWWRLFQKRVLLTKFICVFILLLSFGHLNTHPIIDPNIEKLKKDNILDTKTKF